LARGNTNIKVMGKGGGWGGERGGGGGKGKKGESKKI